MDKVSIIIPTYNCDQYIGSAIESALGQTYKNREIIIIDDGSVDNTKRVLSKYDGEVKYFYQINKGPSSARNLGIQESTGKYIAFLDADDWWDREKLEKSINFMNRNGFDWICTSMIKITQEGGEFIKRIPEDSFVLDATTKEIKQLSKGIFFFGSIAVHTPTIVAKKKCFEKVGLFDESFLICEDTDVWLRFEEAGLRGGYLDEPLTVYRYNERGLTKGGKIDTLEEGSKVAKKHANILGLHNKPIRKSYSGYLWQVAELYFLKKRYLKTVKFIFKSLYYYPKNTIRLLKSLAFQKNKSLWKR